jgi:predicted transcriptional regulator YdeE
MQQIETEKLGGYNVVGLTARISNADGQAAESINALWQKFFEDAVGDHIPHKDGKAIYAVYHDYAGGHEDPYSLTIGCRVENTDFALPPGMESVFVSQGNFAIFAARGEQPKALLQTWEGIWKSNLPRTYQFDVEIYGPRFFEPALHEILVCIGVKL